MAQLQTHDHGLPLLFYGDSYRFPDIFHTIRLLGQRAPTNKEE
jgi:hypothetical protein